MNKVSEASFGAKLFRAQSLSTYIIGFTNYSPAYTEAEPTNYAASLVAIADANNLVAATTTAYSTAIANRSKLFHKEATSVVKIGALIRGFVAGQYGKDSVEYKQIDKQLSKLSSGKVSRTTDADGNIKLGPSQSELSFGSMTQTFANIITILESFNNYNPSRFELQIPQLRANLSNIITANAEVVNTHSPMKVAIDNRKGLYENLSKVSQRIKEYVKGNYGTQSNEYKLIKGLSI
jgi:hypothetical protein